MSWFPIPESLLLENDKWHNLTTTAKVMMLGCMSEGNLRVGRLKPALRNLLRMGRGKALIFARYCRPTNKLFD